MNWLPIETAPKKEEVLIAGSNGAICLGILLRRHPYLDDEYNSGYSWQIEGNRIHGIGEPKYWMPLPAAPVPTGEQSK